MSRVSPVLLLVFLVGCGLSGNLYPVEGPLAQTLQVLRVNCLFGKAKVVMPDGEVCQGECTVGETTSTSFGTAFGSFGHAWAVGYNTGGMSPGMATLYGDRGTILELNFYVSEMGYSGFGMGKDNRGNIYKLHLSSWADSRKSVMGAGPARPEPGP